jgi:hypothetical protein
VQQSTRLIKSGISIFTSNIIPATILLIKLEVYKDIVYFQLNLLTWEYKVKWLTFRISQIISVYSQKLYN